MPDEDPFDMTHLPTRAGQLTHPEFKKCDKCDEYLVWDVWTAQSGTKCKAWRCPTQSMGHTTEFV